MARIGKYNIAIIPKECLVQIKKRYWIGYTIKYWFSIIRTIRDQKKMEKVGNEYYESFFKKPEKPFE